MFKEEYEYLLFLLDKMLFNEEIENEDEWHDLQNATGKVNRYLRNLLKEKNAN